ncbi:MAG: menaquinone biosynthesis decarboxylase [Deltaproteobacteria bacterium]|nr:MAG: menaquinone biosynthesis decarboxylase [Deltaproteobacteria bacterium]
MGETTLKSLVNVLKRKHLLKKITHPVDPVLEISEITNRVFRQGGPALLFENVKGSKFPVLTNLFGTQERVEIAFGKSIKEMEDLVSGLLEMDIPTSLKGSLGILPKLKNLKAMIPKKVSSPPCQEVINRSPSLDDLPILKTWPGDAGRFITLPQVITRDPETGIRNVGMYRLQVYDAVTTGMHWHPHKGGAQHYAHYKKLGKKMPVAVALGGDPLLTYLATAPLPEGMDEWTFAGILRGQRVPIAPCVTQDLFVPAGADFVLEGYVDPEESLKTEGPFGDHTGFYSPPEPFPVFHLTCITHRKKAIYPATVVGKPPMEDATLGKVTERLFLPIIQRLFPEIVDMDLPVHGCFHNFVLVAIDKQYPGHARKIAHALWGLGQMMFSKFIIILDRDVNVHDYGEVLWRIGTHVDPKRDTFLAEGPTDLLDHTSPLSCVGGKMGIDATRKWGEEGFQRPWPDEVAMPDEIVKRVTENWKAYGLDS